jgi:hypothetical protein
MNGNVGAGGVANKNNDEDGGPAGPVELREERSVSPLLLTETRVEEDSSSVSDSKALFGVATEFGKLVGVPTSVDGGKTVSDSSGVEPDFHREMGAWFARVERALERLDLICADIDNREDLSIDERMRRVGLSRDVEK